jgi:hypothetical protein
MQLLKLISQGIVSLIKQVWFFPQWIALALKQRRQRVVLDALESERLDRIRNPSKYLGKS